MNKSFSRKFEDLIEKHLPVAFLDYDSLQQFKSTLTQRDYIGRIELLIISYLTGITAEEINMLLRESGHPPLYVKRREDAIWRFMLNHRPDSAAIIEEIFPQKEDEI